MSAAAELDFRKTRRARKGNDRNSGYEREKNDWYVERVQATAKLLQVESFHGPVWDPACGGGNILTACRKHGLEAYGSDIVQRGAADWIEDFLLAQAFRAPLPRRRRVGAIITNPPFKLAMEFTLHALKLAPKVAVIQQSKWLEGIDRYDRLFHLGHLARTWQFCARESMPPGGLAIEAKGGFNAYMWFVFERDHDGPYYRGGWLR